MKRFTALLALAIGLFIPVMAQDHFENGRHIGPYNENPYKQKGGGIAPAFRTDQGIQPSLVTPVTPQRLPVAPVWSTAQPDIGHSLQYQQYEQSLQQQQPTTPPPAVLPQTIESNPAPVTAPQPGMRATAVSTLHEIEQILDYQPTMKTRVDYLAWYLNGAHIDPAQFLRDGAEWPENSFRQFVANYLISFWNVTMQDSIFRILIPLILVGMILKLSSLLIEKILSGEAL